ncbi:MAG: LptF/LptG family permease, partial [Bacteroidota bacterium]
TMVANKMTWIDSTQSWKLNTVTERTYHPSGFDEQNKQELDTTLTLYPRDLARKTSDVYQLSYAEAQEYISSILRSGAGSVNIPKVHFYGRLAYPFSLPVVILVGFAVASVRHRGGKGIYIGAGLSISFLYLAFMKIIEPFGYYGAISPWMAATIAHLFFLVVGIIMLIKAKK